MDRYYLNQKQVIRGFLILCVVSFLIYQFQGGDLARVLKLWASGGVAILFLYKRPISYESRGFAFSTMTGFIGAIVGVILYLWLYLRYSTATRPPSSIFLLVFLGSYLLGFKVGKRISKTDRFKNSLSPLDLIGFK